MSSDDGVPYDKKINLLFSVTVERKGMFDRTMELKAKFALDKQPIEFENIIQERVRKIARKHKNKIGEEFMREVELDLTMWVMDLEKCGLIEIKELPNEQAH